MATPFAPLKILIAFEFANPETASENPIILVKNVSISYTELKYCNFSIFLSEFGCHGNSLYLLP